MTKPATANRARNVLVDATVISATIGPALTAIDRALAGWPTSTPGAAPLEAQPARPCTAVDDCTHIRPCPIHDDSEPVELTATERNADDGDRARRQLEALERAIRRASGDLAIAARICQNWAWGGLTETEVANQLVAVDAGIWCENCVQYGRHEPRAEDRKRCRFCDDFQRDYKQPAPKAIWDARDARGGKIDVTTIDRILRRLKAEAAERKAEQKARDKAVKNAAKAQVNEDA